MTTSNATKLSDTKLSEDLIFGLVEAMLYTASEPLQISVIVKKLRQVQNKITKQNQTQLSQNEDTQNNDTLETQDKIECVENQESSDIAQVVLPADQIDVLSEETLPTQVALEEESLIGAADVRVALEKLKLQFDCAERGVELVEVARGFQIRTKYLMGEYLRDEKIKAPARLSPSGLETLAIVAYQQPVTKATIEQVRGVDCSGVLKSLLDRDLIRIVGRSEEAGKSAVYGTANKFLVIFGYKSISDLPDPREFEPMFADLRNSQQANEIRVDDLVDEEAWEAVTEEDQQLLGELDSTLKSLKKTEDDIVATHLTEPQPEDQITITESN